MAVLGSSVFRAEAWPAMASLFDHWEVADSRGPPASAAAHKTYSGAAVTARAVAALDDHRGVPLLLWAHYYDAHPPRGIAPEVAPFGPTSLDRYDAELAYADGQWGRLLKEVEARFAPEEVVVVFSADHGEAFDERYPRRGHATTCRPAETQVPFIWQTSGARGERRRGLASHLDLAPTLLGLVGATPPRSMRGESLVPALFDQREPEKYVAFAALWSPRDVGPTLSAAGLFTPTLALLDDRQLGRIELIDHQHDPLGARELGMERPEDVEWTRAVLAAEIDAAEGR